MNLLRRFYYSFRRRHNFKEYYSLKFVRDEAVAKESEVTNTLLLPSSSYTAKNTTQQKIG